LWMEGYMLQHRKKLIEFLKKREWDKKIGKTYPYPQTLLEHSLLTYDVVEKLTNLLRDKNILSNEERKILLVSSIIHDVGKEKDEWQKAVRENKRSPKHIDDTLTKKIVDQLTDIFEIKDKNTVIDAIKFHMSATRTNGNIISSIVSGHQTNRWQDISNFIYSIDNLVSCGTVLEACSLLNDALRFRFAKYFYSTYYQINIRGVSSTFLHKACQQTYEEKGWTPVLYFPEGTIYTSLSQIDKPTVDEIYNKLKGLIADNIKSNVMNLVVPSIIMDNKPIPMPELFDYNEHREYLQKVKGRKNPSEFQKFLKNPTLENKKILKSYNYFSIWNKGKNVIKKTELNKKLKVLKKHQPTIEELKQYCQSTIDCQDEVAIFKFFRASIDKEIWGVEIRDKINPLYNEIFGEGNFDKLMSMSNNDYPHEFAYAIIPFWNIKISSIGYKINSEELRLNNDLLIKELNKEKRIDILIKLLIYIWGNISVKKKPKRKISEKMAYDFLNDIIYPAKEEVNFAKELEYYEQSKSNMKRESGSHLCPICNRFFDKGKKTTSDIVDNPEAFTNRAISHGNPGKIVICESCRSEIYLKQILTKHNGPLNKTIYLFPQFNLSQQLGKEFMDKVFSIKQRAENLMSGLTENPELRMDLFRTYNIAQNVLQYFNDIDTKNLEDLIITQQKDKKIDDKLEKELIKYFEEENLSIKRGKKDYGKALEIINREFSCDYKEWDIFRNDLKSNKIELARDIVKNAYKIKETYKIIAQTPNMVIIPLINPIKWGDEADVNGAFRELFVSIILALKLNCSVAITDNINKIDISQRRGLVYVPENHLVRQIMGDEWIRDYDYINPKGRFIYSAEKWLRVITSAIVLSPKTAYSDRTNIFEILSARTTGHLLRRIEIKDKDKKTNNAGYIETYNLIENIKEVTL